MVISLNIPDNREALRYLLGINTKWVFSEGFISVLHPNKFVYSEYELKGLRELKEDTMNEMEKIDKFLKSKSSSIVKVFTSQGYIVQQIPFQHQIKIPVLEYDSKTMDSFSKIMNDIEYAEEYWIDGESKKHSVATFTVDTTEFIDMLRMIEESDMTEISVDSFLKVQNKRSEEFCRSNSAKVTGKATILLGTQTYGYLLNSLFGEKTTIKVADDALMFIKNLCKTLIAGRIE